MRKIIFLLFFISLSFSQEILFNERKEETVISYYFRESEEFYKLITKLSKGIVLCYLEGTKTTGFFVSSDGWIITNLHLSDRNFVNELRILVKLEIGLENDIYQSEKVIPHPSSDLLLIKINYKPAFHFKNFRNPYFLEEVWLLGFRTNSGKSLSPPGYVTQDTYRSDLLRSTTPGMAGNSGSPVINRKGEVLGICTLMYTGTTPDILFIPSEVIVKFLKEHIK